MARKRKQSGTVVFGIVSDTHCGSLTALAPPEPIPLDDGQTLSPSKAQLWIWQGWERFWAEVARVRDAEDARLIVELNGDLVDGPGHHGTAQSASLHPGTEKDIAWECLRLPRALNPDHWFVVRGTEVHAGKSGSGEEVLARRLEAEKDPDTGQASWWRVKMEIQGLRLDFAHHGRQGLRPWTEANAVSLLAAQIWMEHARVGQPAPHLAIRSHRHRFGDSYKAHPTRVVQTPSFQLKAAHAHKVVTEAISDIGGVIVTLRNGEIDVREVVQIPEQAATWRMAA